MAELIGIHCGSTVTSLEKKENAFIQLFYNRDGARDCFKMSQRVELFQAAEQPCILLISPSSLVFSPRNYSDRRPSGAMAPGAGAHAEGLPGPGPGGHCCPEGDLSSQTAEA